MFLTITRVRLSITRDGSSNSPEVEVTEGGQTSDDYAGCDHCEGISRHLQAPPDREILEIRLHQLS